MISPPYRRARFAIRGEKHDARNPICGIQNKDELWLSLRYRKWIQNTEDRHWFKSKPVFVSTAPKKAIKERWADTFFIYSGLFWLECNCDAVRGTRIHSQFEEDEWAKIPQHCCERLISTYQMLELLLKVGQSVYGDRLFFFSPWVIEQLDNLFQTRYIFPTLTMMAINVFCYSSLSVMFMPIRPCFQKCQVLKNPQIWVIYKS